MTRITTPQTPLDSFMKDLAAWLDGAWFIWIALAVAIAVVVLSVTLTKVRARARARVPQYRRQQPS